MSASVGASTRGNRTIAFTHPKSLAESTWTIFTTKKFCDVKFLVGPSETEVLAHKLLLMARSPVFATMFADRWTSNGNAGDTMTVVPLNDADPDAFRLFLRYIYTDHFAPDMSKAWKLCQLAHKYDVLPLVQKCDEFISNHFCDEESLEFFQLGRCYTLNKLMAEAGGVLARDFEQLLSSNTILRTMDRETLIYLLKRDDLELAEIKIFEITLTWAGIQASSSGRIVQDILREIIPFIRFPLMDVQDFIRTVLPTELLPNEDVIALFTYFNADGDLRNTLSNSMRYSSKRRAFLGRTSVKIDLYKPCANYPHQNNLHFHNFVPHNTYDTGFIETIRFYYDQTGITSQLAVLSGLTLQIPDLRTYFNGRHESLPSEFYVNISIDSGSAHYSASVDRYRAQLSRGVKTKIELPQPLELRQGHNCSICIAFEGRVSLLNQVSWATDPNVDARTGSAIPVQITQPVGNGTIQLSEIQLSNNKHRRQGYHAVKQLHLQLRNNTVGQAGSSLSTMQKYPYQSNHKVTRRWDNIEKSVRRTIRC